MIIHSTCYCKCLMHQHPEVRAKVFLLFSPQVFTAFTVNLSESSCITELLSFQGLSEVLDHGFELNHELKN